MRKTIVLIVEDLKDTGEMLKAALERRGFEAYHVLGRQEAQDIMNQLPEIDVAVLDMKLGDGVTGIDVGMDLRAHYGSNSPEFVVYSAYDKVQYYQGSIDLGAAIYLQKAGGDYKQVVTHVRVLSIVRAIQGNMRTMSDIARSSKSAEDAIYRVFEKILEPQISATLGAPFMLLASRGDEHRRIGTAPEKHTVYEHLQKMVRETKMSGFVHITDLIKSDILTPDHQTETKALLDNSESFVLLPLYRSDNIRVVLVIGDNYAPGSIQEKAFPLAEALHQHLRDKVLEGLIATTQHLTIDELKKRKQLESVARVCFMIGQMYKDAEGETQEQGRLEMMKHLTDDLQVMSQQLTQILEEQASLQTVEMRGLIDKIWQKLVPEHQQGLLHLPDFCEVKGNKASLVQAIRQILVWMLGRYEKCPTDNREIHVQAMESNGYCVITLRDHSKRMRKRLRRDLFMPFPSTASAGTSVEGRLGLFVAHMLIEISNLGYLEDVTDNLDSDLGHCFEIRLLPPG